MATPNPSAVGPWYLRNINQALGLDEVTGNVYMRSSIVGGNVTIAGNVIVSNITVDAMGNVDISGNTLPVSGNINIDAGNVTVLQGTSPWVISGNANIDNFPATQEVTQGTDPWVVSGNVNATLQGTSLVTFAPENTDAFGRLRVSNPFTLYDTQARYYDHNQFSSSVIGTASVVYNANSSTYELNVSASNGDSILRETVRTFPYQPGKSLLVLNTFCMSTPKLNLRQRVGYFGEDNGIFFEANGTTLNMVIRSSSSGAIVEDRIPQSAWNGDRLNGAGGTHNPSGITLDPALVQIFWMDVEWLGVGSVRVGFIINGKFYTCHTFQHANTVSTLTTDNTTTYMTTASLPVRYEITNTGGTTGPSLMRQVCSTVISEGGYQLSGDPGSVGHNLGSAIVLPNDQSFKPLISIRLKSTNLDAIVIPTNFSIAPVSQSVFKYRIYKKAVTAGGTWTAFVSDSSVEYNLNPTSVSSGVIADEAFIISSNQSSTAPANQQFSFNYQLERNSFSGVAYEYVISCATTGTNQNVYASIEWQEVT